MTTFVVCKTYQEYDYWRRVEWKPNFASRTPNGHVVMCTTAQSSNPTLRGRTFRPDHDEVVFTGQWAKGPSSDEIYWQLRTMGWASDPEVEYPHRDVQIRELAVMYRELA